MELAGFNLTQLHLLLMVPYDGTDIQEVINLILVEGYSKAADVNGDGEVDGTDIQEIINIILLS